jgi:hypothetical protein
MSELRRDAVWDRRLLEPGLRTPTLAVILDVAHALGVEPTQLVSDTIAPLREKVNDATTTCDARRRVVRS